MDAPFFPKVKGHQVLPSITKGWRFPLDLLGNILMYILDDLAHHLHFCFERMIKFVHKFIDLLSIIYCWLCGFHAELLLSARQCFYASLSDSVLQTISVKTLRHR